MLKSCATTFLLCCGISLCATAEGDEAAVRKTLAAYVDVFNQKAADQVGSFWTATGTHTDRETGERTEGREAIQADLAAVLETQPNLKLSATIDRFKMVTKHVANIEGQTTLVAGESEPIISTFTAIVVRQGDKWLLDSIEEMELPQPENAAAALSGLTWLVGDWVDDSSDTVVKTTFRWTASQAFLLRSFSVESADGGDVTGTQVIGWDPRTLQIRSWSFNSNGSFGESVWSKSDGSWRSKSVHTLATGEVASGTYVMERLDDDSFTMQLVGHEVDGLPQPAGPTAKVVRVQQKSASTSTPQN